MKYIKVTACKDCKYYKSTFSYYDGDDVSCSYHKQEIENENTIPDWCRLAKIEIKMESYGEMSGFLSALDEERKKTISRWPILREQIESVKGRLMDEQDKGSETFILNRITTLNEVLHVMECLDKDPGYQWIMNFERDRNEN